MPVDPVDHSRALLDGRWIHLGTAPACSICDLLSLQRNPECARKPRQVNDLDGHLCYYGEQDDAEELDLFGGSEAPPCPETAFHCRRSVTIGLRRLRLFAVDVD
jgi:hypothetical protein